MKPLIFQTSNIWSDSIYSLNYQSSITSGCRDIRINESEFVAKFLLLFSLFPREPSIRDKYRKEPFLVKNCLKLIRELEY